MRNEFILNILEEWFLSVCLLSRIGQVVYENPLGRVGDFMTNDLTLRGKVD